MLLYISITIVSAVWLLFLCYLYHSVSCATMDIIRRTDLHSGLLVNIVIVVIFLIVLLLSLMCNSVGL